jgi:hypothetical protein
MPVKTHEILMHVMDTLCSSRPAVTYLRALRDNVGDGAHLFASLEDSATESSGIYFGKDPHTLFVNIQHAVTQNDKKMVPTYRQAKDLDDDDLARSQGQSAPDFPRIECHLRVKERPGRIGCRCSPFHSSMSSPG